MHTNVQTVFTSCLHDVAQYKLLILDGNIYHEPVFPPAEVISTLLNTRQLPNTTDVNVAHIV